MTHCNDCDSEIDGPTMLHYIETHPERVERAERPGWVL